MTPTAASWWRYARGPARCEAGAQPSSRRRGTSRTRSRRRRARTSTRYRRGTPASRGDGLLGVAEPAGHHGKDLAGHAGLVPNDLVERGLEEPDRADGRLGDHRGGPRSAVEQRDLAEELPRPAARDRAVVSDDPHLSLDDDEEGSARLPGLHDDLPLAERDLVGVLGDLPEVPARQPL